MYAPDALVVVYCPQCWWSDDWDPRDYGRTYDFSIPFFEQYHAFFREVPLLGLSLDLQTTRESPYNNHAGYLKNCYLLFQANHNENCAYGFGLLRNHSVFDSSAISESELCYNTIHAWRDNRCIGVTHTNNSLASAFLRDSDNCQYCFASANLRNKQYCLFNKPRTKEQYEKEIQTWNLGSYHTYREAKAKAAEHWKQYPPKPYWNDFSTDVTGNYVFESKNCRECYEVINAQDSKYLMLLDSVVRDCYDISSWGDNLSLSYDSCVVGEQTTNVRFCQESGIHLHDAEYCKLSTGGSHHFGCVSMKKGDYYIFNRPYTKERYAALREKIVAHMNDMPYVDKKGHRYRYGEFFPIALSPFGYNETMAKYLFPLLREHALDKGYPWRERPEEKYRVTTSASSLPDHVRDASDDILRAVIACADCGRGYRIIPMELKFLREQNLPLPRRCPFCRIEEHMRQWAKGVSIEERACHTCGAFFRTPYGTTDAPRLLCLSCWKKEVL